MFNVVNRLARVSGPVDGKLARIEHAVEENRIHHELLRLESSLGRVIDFGHSSRVAHNVPSQDHRAAA